MSKEVIIKTDGIDTRLEKYSQDILERAKSFIVDSDEAYAEAAEIIRSAKKVESQIIEYWSAPKKAAKQAHNDICAKEKAWLLGPQKAQTILKISMVTYNRTKQEERKKQEEELRKKQQEERDKLLQQALEAEAAGKKESAELAFAQAAIIEDMPPATLQKITAIKTKGTSVRKVWKARITDEAKVPLSANGVVIRPIDIKALNAIAKLTGGTAKVPGVEFYRDEKITIRA